MKRKKIYDYLESKGVLSQGSDEAIKQAKEEYWKKYRKAWRQQQRLECKSYKVFFSQAEYKEIIQTRPKGKPNVAGYIKQVIIQHVRMKSTIDREIIGEIRTIFFEYYRVLETLTEANTIKDLFLKMERQVLILITEPKRHDHKAIDKKSGC